MVARTILLLALLGCDQRSPEQKRVDAARELIRSADASKRAEGATSVAGLCCGPDEFRASETVAREFACPALRNMLDTENDPTVVERLLVHTTAYIGEACYFELEIPTSTIARLCRSGCSDFARILLARMLAEHEPSPELFAALQHQIEVPALGTPGFFLEGTLYHTLQFFGELEIAPALLDGLRSTDPNKRSRTLKALGPILGAPLRIDPLLPLLDEAAADPDRSTAYLASDLAGTYRYWHALSPDEAVARLLHSDVEDRFGDRRLFAIRALGVRRFSCDAVTAAAVLERLAEDPDEKIARKARESIALRQRRCAGF